MQVGGQPAPRRIAKGFVVNDQVRVRECRITHPDPYQVIAFLNRITTHFQCLGNSFLAGNLDADAILIEFHAVIHTADTIALDSSHRQRSTAMTTTIIKRYVTATFATIQNNRFFKYGPGEFPAVDQFVVPGCHVPAISEENLFRI